MVWYLNGPRGYYGQGYLNSIWMVFLNDILDSLYRSVVLNGILIQLFNPTFHSYIYMNNVIAITLCHCMLPVSLTTFVPEPPYLRKTYGD